MTDSITVIMSRDGVAYEVAAGIVKEGIDAVLEAIHNGDIIDAEDIWMDVTGLEPDYIMDHI